MKVLEFAVALAPKFWLAETGIAILAFDPDGGYVKRRRWSPPSAGGKAGTTHYRPRGGCKILVAVAGPLDETAFAFLEGVLYFSDAVWPVNPRLSGMLRSSPECHWRRRKGIVVVRWDGKWCGSWQDVQWFTCWPERSD